MPCTAIALESAESVVKPHANVGVASSRGPKFKKAGKESIEDFLNMLNGAK
jgi:hypothetical protein